jgi:hypothetical protein
MGVTVLVWGVLMAAMTGVDGLLIYAWLNPAGHTALPLGLVAAAYAGLLIVTWLLYPRLANQSPVTGLGAGWLWWTGVAGVSLPLALDRLNILVPYEAWLARGQPTPPAWRTEFLIGVQLVIGLVLLGSALARRFGGTRPPGGQ